MDTCVYLAGPMTGCTEDEIQNWRIDVTTKLYNYGVHCVNPFRGEEIRSGELCTSPDLKNHLKAKQIIQKNYLDCLKCDMVYAYLPKAMNDRRPSYGTMFEIAWFCAQNKITILVTDDLELVSHPVIAGQIGYIYDNHDDAILATADLLLPYANANV